MADDPRFVVANFVQSRSETAEEFYCERCARPKKAKSKAHGHTVPDGKAVIICNGCYGNIKAREAGKA